MITAIRGARRLLLAGLICSLPAIAGAQPADLSQATLEELLSLEVTSAGRHAQRAENVAAAVYVISRDDIQSSGLTLLPEILRLAPGVQVAQVNASTWAVSVRGFNSVYSNKLLILVDGRSLYNRSFSGVFWDAQDLDVAEIERIEVIRGPGGAMWGANAVNGVINIITRSAHASTGLAASVSAGTFEHARASLRYGGTLGRASYRLYGQWSGYGEGLTVGGVPNEDQWQSAAGGYRLDWANATNTVMTQGHYTDGRTHPRFTVMESFAPDVFSTTGTTTFKDVNALVRWTRTAEDGSLLQAQGYVTQSRRDGRPMYSNERSGDVDIQYEKPLNHQLLVVGGGYRFVDLATRSTYALQLEPERMHLVNAFIQDEVALPRRVTLTVGVRLEHENIVGWGASPSARVLWEASARHRVWGALARTRRTPSAIDRTLRFNSHSIPGPGLPVLIAIVGTPDYHSEQLVQADAGYRIRIGATASMDLTVFRGRYDRLPTSEPQMPVFEGSPEPDHLLAPIQWANLMAASTTGVELAAHWSPLNVWRFDAAYSALRITPEVDAASLDAAARQFDGNAPRHQWHVRSTARVGARTQVHAALHRVGALRQLFVPAYTRLDAHVALALAGGLTVRVAGRNLLAASHEEFYGTYAGISESSVPRSARLQLGWQF